MCRFENNNEKGETMSESDYESMQEAMVDAVAADAARELEAQQSLLPAQYSPPPEDKALATTDPKANRAMEVAAALDQAYPGASKARINPEEAIILRRPFPDEEVEIRPHDGLLYIPHILISERLNDAIGMGEWAMVRRREWMDNHLIYAEWIMLVRGCFIGESVTSHRYIPNNPQMDYADALEATRGVAIRRIAAKDLSCGSQVWHPAYCREWQAKFAYFDGKARKWARKPLAASEPAPAVSAQAHQKSSPQAKPEPKSKAPAETDADKIKRWVSKLQPYEPYATYWLIDNGKLLPTESLVETDISNVPKTKKEAESIIASIKERMELDGAEVPADPVHADSSPKSEPAEDSIMLKVIGALPVPWKEVEVPFGKAKGQKFGDLEKGQLWWWCTEWNPKPWAGKDGRLRDPSEFDQALRWMLDQVQEKYGFKAKGE